MLHAVKPKWRNLQFVSVSSLPESPPSRKKYMVNASNPYGGNQDQYAQQQQSTHLRPSLSAILLTLLEQRLNLTKR